MGHESNVHEGMGRTCPCGAEAEYVLAGHPACALHRAVADVACEEIGEPAPRWELVRAVGIMALPILLFLGGCGNDRAGPDVDPILYVLALWLAAIVVVALASDRIVRWVERRADVQTRDESEMESGS